jgi:hypothetical protein
MSRFFSLFARWRLSGGATCSFRLPIIGMIRAAGIPARFEIGFPLPAEHANQEDVIPGYRAPWSVGWRDS